MGYAAKRALPPEIKPFYKNDPHNAVLNNIAIWGSKKSYIVSGNYVCIRSFYHFPAPEHDRTQSRSVRGIREP